MRVAPQVGLALLLLTTFNPTGLKSGTSQTGESRSRLAACTVSGVNARCGKVEVFENREARTGRKIALNVVVLPATGPEPAPDPLVYISGGPGSAATEEASDLAEAFAAVRQRRDLLFVDQRGTGQSNPLNCELFNPADLQSYLGYFFPLEDVRKCRQDLEQRADLTLYTTSIAADDLDDVRAALGYEKLNLMGASYGTRAAMEYLRRHPDHVRTVTLHGVSPTNHFMPMDFARQTERALQGVLAECAADNACKKAFPNLDSESRAVLDRLMQGPVEVEVRAAPRRENTGSNNRENNPPTVRVKLSRDLAAEAIRYMLYHPGAARYIPLFLHRAAAGDFTNLAEAAIRNRKQIVASGSNGMYLSVTCAEDLPWIETEEVARFSRNTFLGDYRFRQQREACSLWPRGKIPSDYSTPVKSGLPVLILTGQWDPVTPPANGDFVARYFSNSLHIVVPHGGHGFGGLEGADCVLRLNTEFIEKGTTKGLDSSCIRNIRRTGFAEK
jgi:pimeloyl-ACP methyl ester carboxylesterase